MGFCGKAVGVHIERERNTQSWVCSLVYVACYWGFRPRGSWMLVNGEIWCADYPSLLLSLTISLPSMAHPVVILHFSFDSRQSPRNAWISRRLPMAFMKIANFYEHFFPIDELILYILNIYMNIDKDVRAGLSIK